MRPPRLAQWLLARLRDPDAREAISGDLDEGFAARAAQNPRAARRWYWRQTMASLAWRARSQSDLTLPASPSPGLHTMIETLVVELRQITRGLRRAPGFAAAI